MGRIAPVKETKTCKFCNKEFERNKRYSPKQWENALFCTRQCAGKYKRRSANNTLRNDLQGDRLEKAFKANPDWRVEKWNG
ncbi:MAG: DUF2256 domain-containing protein [Candidatus Dadabacteria bacterium]|nr:DUF2256 domain-containing protein [Candidatus Dadabacteria bacterium]